MLSRFWTGHRYNSFRNTTFLFLHNTIHVILCTMFSWWQKKVHNPFVFILPVGVNSQTRHLLAPQNTVHLIGQATPPLYFNCSIEFEDTINGFLWIEYITRPLHSGGTTVALANVVRPAPPEGDPAVVVLQEFKDEYEVERQNLIVIDANFDDAGTYGCRSNIQQTLTDRRAEAIVLGKFIFSRGSFFCGLW